MNSVEGSLVASDSVLSNAATPQLSLLRLYCLRIAYFVMAAGIGVYFWPTIIHHTDELAATRGIQFGLLGGLGLMAVLGLRYPVRMLPILLFELTWKAVYLAAFAFPLWSAHRITDAVANDIRSVLFVVIFIPLIPWRYVFAHYVSQPGDRWT